MFNVSWEPRITEQWKIPNYNDPWSQDRQPSRAKCKNIEPAYTNEPKSCYVKNIKTGEVKYFSSYTDTAKFLKIVASSLPYYINSSAISKSTYYLSSTPDFSDKKQKFYIITNNKTGQKVKCKTIAEYLDDQNITKWIFDTGRQKGMFKVERVEL
jgi:hypothetical protein